MTLAQIFLAAIANNITTRDYLLYLIYKNSPAGGGTGAATTLTSTRELVNSSVSAGSLAVTFTTSDDFSGTINGEERQASTSYVFNPTSGYVNPEINYAITTGSLIIDVYRAA